MFARHSACWETTYACTYVCMYMGMYVFHLVHGWIPTAENADADVTGHHACWETVRICNVPEHVFRPRLGDLLVFV